MPSRLIRFLPLLLVGLLVSGCETVDSLSKEEVRQPGAATGEDQGLSPAEMEAMDAQNAAGREDLTYKDEGAGAGVGRDRVIYFDYDSDAIRPAYRKIVEAHAAYMAAHPDAVITLEGHADERGSREYNLALGERRAQAVREQLTLLGGSAAQVRTVSYGEERPANEGHDEQAYAMNRRVEIIY
ncbi:MAG: peptidoglycan-associated lipoprotein Pal [Gammaproteobacteria bacterium]